MWLVASPRRTGFSTRLCDLLLKVIKAAYILRNSVQYLMSVAGPYYRQSLPDIEQNYSVLHLDFTHHTNHWLLSRA